MKTTVMLLACSNYLAPPFSPPPASAFRPGRRTASSISPIASGCFSRHDGFTYEFQLSRFHWQQSQARDTVDSTGSGAPIS